MFTGILLFLALGGLFQGAASIEAKAASAAAQPDPAQLEFFEKRIRPVLAENCYKCHSASAKNRKGGLELDFRDGILRGGNTGPAVIPGDPARSLMLRAVSHTDSKLKMPPDGKLDPQEIADLETWIRMGAPDPREQPAPGVTKEIDFARARQFWCFKPIEAPVIAKVSASSWPASPLDNYILSRLESRGLIPADKADRLTLIRRATLDLTGLPPTRAEIRDFLADPSPAAFARVVDRLLASPHYGERWTRHWLDLVRFAETNGHEFDNPKLDAWRYRDYLIRAFNEDLPYRQLIREHIAGDLIADKRISRDGAQWESPVGSSFFWFGEVLNSATDSIKSRADQVDNQIDVTAKAFLGLTVACARCHDHKFDPIPTDDYYALAGILHSTDVQEAVIDSPSHAAAIASCHEKIAGINRSIERATDRARLPLASQLKNYLLAAGSLFAAEPSKPKEPAPKEAPAGIDVAAREKKSGPSGDKVSAVARMRGLDPLRLQAWVRCLRQAEEDRSHILYPFAQLIRRSLGPLAGSPEQLVSLIRKELLDQAEESSLLDPSRKARGDIVFEDFEKLSYEGWTLSGQAFADAPARQIPVNQSLSGYAGQGIASSFRGSDAFVGSLTSRKFKMPKFYLHVRMSGSSAAEEQRSDLRFTVVADDHKSQNLAISKNPGAFQWKTVRLTKEFERICYFEIVDRSRKGHIVVDEIVLSDSSQPPALAPHPGVLRMLGNPGLISVEALAGAYQKLLLDTLSRTPRDRDALWLSSALHPAGEQESALKMLPIPQRTVVNNLQAQRSRIEAQVPGSAFAMISADRDPHNARLHIRGDHKNLGHEIPRGFLRVISGAGNNPVAHGSGRLQLADWIAGARNPLPARVVANWIWKHHFGEGIVRSVENFGYKGEVPTHPELLDYLAHTLMSRGWSLKALHREIMLSSAYRMSSRAAKGALAADPENKLLHHMPIRRLEAEAIRDSILAVSGKLDRRLFGPSVVPHISKYQDGRGKPKSGPLDGEGRRSIYIEVRRNFLTPMFLAFDYPLPISTIGRRMVSNVPSQPLIMMNNEFVTQQARAWAMSAVAAERDPELRLQQMYWTAFGRAPQKWEIDEVLNFGREQQEHYRIAGAEKTTTQSNGDKNGRPAEAQQEKGVSVEQKVWADIAHVLLNSAEFIYVP